MQKLLLIVLAAALAASLGGCQRNVEGDAPDVEESASPTATEGTPSAGAEAMSADGPGESAALQGLDASLAEGKAISDGTGQPWPDLSGAEPAFTAYLLAVDMDGQTTLCEVRADGIAHGLYAYQKPFDAGTLIWSPSDMSSGTRAEAQSDRERAAVAEIDAAMRDAFPDSAFTVSVFGYRFAYTKDGVQLLILEVAPDGSVISVGS